MDNAKEEIQGKCVLYIEIEEMDFIDSNQNEFHLDRLEMNEDFILKRNVLLI